MTKSKAASPSLGVRSHPAVTTNVSLVPLMIARVMLKMILTVQPFLCRRHSPHPAHRLAVSALDIELRALLLQLSCDGVDIHVQIIAEEFANFRVLMVANEIVSSFGRRGVYIHVGSWKHNQHQVIDIVYLNTYQSGHEWSIRSGLFC